MAKLNDFRSVEQFKTGLEQILPTCKTIAAAGQRCTDLLFEKFGESVALTRVFLTLPYEKMPAADQEFVMNLARAKGVDQNLSPKTPVLSLLGTRGQEQAWNDRRKSKGHLGIPLVSADFVQGIPMISRLLRDLGVSMEWLTGDGGVQVETRGTLSGVFYVDDAATTLDAQRRNVIADQAFVKNYKVKSVFAVGGQYILQRMCVILIVFAKDSLSKSEAAAFLPIANLFKSLTVNAASQGHVY